jgi:hypothetical protein
MKKHNKKFSLLTVLLAALAVCLLLVGGIGVTRAALNIQSETYTGTLETPDIAIQLNENSKAVSGEDTLLKGLLKEGESFTLGKVYDEVLTVTNTGSADQFARVTLYKYWTDEKGKRVDLDPAYIRLVLGEDWAVDEAASTPERTVVYYTKVLAPGAESTPLLKQISADSEVSIVVAQETKSEETIGDVTYTKIETTYVYDGLSLNLEASADAIQTHHAQDAIEASWGTTNVTADEGAGTLSVN